MTPRRFASINPSLHPHWIPYSPDLSVIVLSGGRSTRMGQDKATLDLEGETLLERTVRAAQVIGPSRIIVAGPEPRGTAPGSTIRGIPFVREDPPYGGVALSIRAALCELDSLPPRTEPKVPGRSQPQGEDWVLVLPVDLYDPCGAALELVGHRHDSMLRPTSTISDGPVDGWIAVTDDAAPRVCGVPGPPSRTRGVTQQHRGRSSVPCRPQAAARSRTPHSALGAKPLGTHDQPWMLQRGSPVGSRTCASRPVGRQHRGPHRARPRPSPVHLCGAGGDLPQLAAIHAVGWRV